MFAANLMNFPYQNKLFQHKLNIKDFSNLLT